MSTYMDGMEGGKHDSENAEAKSKIKTYTVSVTFTDMVAENPLDAAKKACKWLLENNDAEKMVYDVMDEDTNEKFSVDLSEDDDNAVLPD